MNKYCIVTFGCAQNVADSERIAASFENRGYKNTDDWKKADTIVINTCVVRQQAEDRVYGLVRNISLYFQQIEGVDFHGLQADIYGNKNKNHITNPKFQINSKSKISKKQSVLNPLEISGNPSGDDVGSDDIDKRKENRQMPKIIVTGCLVGVAARDKTGKILARLRARMPEVDEFLPIEEVGFNLEPVRSNKEQGLVVISNGCNNFCTFCVVPFSRGREVSRPFEDIIEESRKLKEQGYKKIMLLGQNVNSYGSDLVAGEKYLMQLARDVNQNAYFDNNLKFEIRNFESKSEKFNKVKIKGKEIKPVIVKHLGKYRIPTLFPYLLEAVAQMGFEHIDFMSSNPWDFSDELIDVIARNPNITRQIHLPVQSGSDDVLKRMNRWYSAREYLELVKSLKCKVQSLKITTDIIVGFPGETEEEFQHTVDLCKKIKYEKAYVSIYSSRPMTGATIAMRDDVPFAVKKKRWEELDKMINHKRRQRHV